MSPIEAAELRPGALVRIFGKRSQWEASDLPWETEVDQERLAAAEATLMGGFAVGAGLAGTPFATWGERDWVALSIEAQN